MSLEIAIAENTAAIRELLAHLKGNPIATAKAEKTPAAKETTPAPTKASEPTGAAETAATTPSASTQAAASGEPVTLEAATELLKKVIAKCGRDAAVSLLKDKMGVNKLSELSAARLSDFAAEANKALA